MPLDYRASDRQTLTLLLIAATRKLTGKPHYGALAELLTAAMPATYEDVSPSALLQLAKDHESDLTQLESLLDHLLPILLGKDQESLQTDIEAAWDRILPLLQQPPK